MMDMHLLISVAGTDAKMNGWHEDRPESGPALANWRGNKLMLMVSELVEAHDELRNGNDADQTYYVGESDKPEGVPSELADVVIRIADFCYTEGIDLDAIIKEKLAYNRQRGYKHGGKKF